MNKILLFVPFGRSCCSITLSLWLFVIFSGCTNKLLLYPSTKPIPVSEESRHEIFIKDARVEMFCEVFGARDEANKPLEFFVLHFVGNGQRAENGPGILGGLSQRHFEECRVNYPGFGRSQGPARLNKIPEAALAAFDDLQVRAVGKPIFVSGYSMGTTAALYLATQREVAGVVLLNPPPLRQMILGRFGWWNLWLAALPIAWQVPKKLGSIQNAKQAKAPAIFLTATKDQTVPLRYQEKIVAAYSGEKHQVNLPGAGHSFVPRRNTVPELADKIAVLLEQMLPLEKAIATEENDVQVGSVKE